jgi:hypothetical protein
MWTGADFPVGKACVGQPYGGVSGLWIPTLGSRPLTFALAGSTTNEPPPAGAAIDTAKGVISWRPSAAQVPVVEFTVAVENARGADYARWVVLVEDCPAEPIGLAAAGGCGCCGGPSGLTAVVLLAAVILAARRRRG